MDRYTLADWLEDYAAAWEDRDPDAAAALFKQDGSYHVTPFRSHDGKGAIRDYWASATADQDTVAVDTEVITITEDGTGIGRFRAEITDRDGERSVTDGICLLELEGNECTRFREWWHKDS